MESDDGPAGCEDKGLPGLSEDKTLIPDLATHFILTEPFSHSLGTAEATR